MKGMMCNEEKGTVEYWNKMGVLADTREVEEVKPKGPIKNNSAVDVNDVKLSMSGGGAKRERRV